MNPDPEVARYLTLKDPTSLQAYLFYDGADNSLQLDLDARFAYFEQLEQSLY